jgi:hypothetical protein
MAKARAKTKTKKRKSSKRKRSAEQQVVAEAPDIEASQEQDTATAVAVTDDAAKTAEEKKSEEESIHAKYERIKKGDLYLTDLQKLTVAELHNVARDENIKEFTALKKQELIFKILKERIRQNGLLYGEGVLEVLPDGYGFLRRAAHR